MRVVKQTKTMHYSVTIDDQYIGHIFGDWAVGFTAFDHKGRPLGHWPPTDPEAKWTATEAVEEVWNAREVVAALGATVIEVTIPSQRTDKAAA